MNFQSKLKPNFRDGGSNGVFRYRKDGFGIIAAVSALFLTAPFFASAHAFGQNYTLPLPVWLYLYGGGAAIVISFFIIAYFISHRGDAFGYRRFEISNLRIIHALKQRWFRGVMRALSLLLFLIVIFAGIFGESFAGNNFESTFFWIIFLLGFTYLVAIVGDLWKFANPLGALFFSKNARPLVRYPSVLGYVPAVIFYYILLWLEFLSGGLGADPPHLALFLLLYSFFAIGGAIAFGPELWFQFGEVFSVFFRLVAKIAPIEYRNGRVFLRLPFVGLLEGEADHGSLIFFILLILAGTAYDGFRETIPWFRFNLAVTPHIPFLDTATAWSLLGTLALITAPILFLALYTFALWLMKFLIQSSLSLGVLMKRFAFSLVPIVLAYNVAHYYTLLLVQGQAIIPLLSNPFNRGWNLFHTAGYKINVGIVSSNFIWHSEVAVILIGHIASIYLAHRIALSLWPARRQVMISQIPMLMLMVAYTMIGLWILSQPLSTGL